MRVLLKSVSAAVLVLCLHGAAEEAQAEFRDLSLDAGVISLSSGYTSCSYRLRLGESRYTRDTNGTVRHRTWRSSFLPFEQYLYRGQFNETGAQEHAALEFSFTIPEQQRHNLIPFIPEDGTVELPNGTSLGGNGDRASYLTYLRDSSQAYDCKLFLRRNLQGSNYYFPEMICELRDFDNVVSISYPLEKSYNDGNGDFGYLVLQEDCQ